MSKKETKEDLKNLSHDDLVRLGASLVVKHLADSYEIENTKNEDNH